MPQSSLDVRISALAGPTRRAIFERLAEGASSVGEIAATLPVTRPAVSQHLRVLLDAGLVTVTTEGARRVYSVHPDGVAVLKVWLEDMWDRAMAGFAGLAAREMERSTK